MRPHHEEGHWPAVTLGDGCRSGLPGADGLAADGRVRRTRPAGVGIKRWGSRPARSGTTDPCMAAPAEIPQVRVRVTSRKKPIDKRALLKVILCALLSLRS